MSNTLTNTFSSDSNAFQATDLFALGAASPVSPLTGVSAESVQPFADVLVASQINAAVPLLDVEPAATPPPVPVQETTASATPSPLLPLTFHPCLIGPLNAAKLAGVPTEALPSESSGCSIGREANEARCESLPDAAPAEENSSAPTEEQTENAGQILALLQQGIVIIDYVFRAPPIAPAASAETFLAANSAAAPASEPSQVPLSAHGLESRNLFANSTMRPAQNAAVRPEKLATTVAPLTGPSLIDAPQSTPPEAVSVFPSTSAASLAAPSAPLVLPLAAQPLSPRTTESVRVDSPVTLQLSPQATAQLAAASLSSSVSAPVASDAPQALAAAQAKLAGISAQGLSPEPAKEFTPVMRSDKKSLSVGSKLVTRSNEVVGTSTANPKFSMLNPSQDYAITTSPFSTVTNFASTLERTWNPESFAAEAPAPALASQAVHVVREIRDIADGLWATERNSVELRFNFEGHDQLSVRVEYRDGDVRATFRTNSPELRDALAGEWHTQQSQQGHYTMLAPVFENGPAPASRSGFFSNENFSRDQQNAQQFSQHARDDAHSHGRKSPAFFHGEAETPTRATPHVQPTARHPSARLLHAQA